MSPASNKKKSDIRCTMYTTKNLFRYLEALELHEVTVGTKWTFHMVANTVL